MTVYYTTINDIQEQLSKETPATVPDATAKEYANFVAYLQNQLIPQVSEFINNETHRFFVPEYMTDILYNRNLASLECLEDYGYYFDLEKYRLHLLFDLLEIVTYTSVSTVITSTEFRIVGTPGVSVDLDWDGDDFDFGTDTFSDAQNLLGWFGYHTDWTNAWSTVESVTVDDSALAVTVASDANDKYKFPQYVRCEDEVMLVTAIASATSITVERGVRGTTAAAHSTKALQTFNIDESLHIAATRMCSWLYMNRTAQGNVVQLSDSAVIMDLLPTMVKDTLDRLTKRAAV